jgi:23S rRNA (guanosine2251-2'-O)-methyltransferase
MMSKSGYVAGLRAVEQLLAGDPADVRRILVEYRAVNPRVKAVIESARGQGIDVQEANRARLRQIGGEARHQGVVAEIRRPTVLDEAALRNLVEGHLAEARSPLMLLVLDGIQDPHNLGACLRSADAAGVDAVVAPRHGAAGLGPTVSKVAAGAAEQLPFAQVVNIGRVLDWLSDYGVTRVGTSDKAADTLYDTALNGHIALVMGREEKGLTRSAADRCDVLVRLPMSGTVSSLNVSVATGVCLYEAVRQRLQTP